MKTVNSHDMLLLFPLLVFCEYGPLAPQCVLPCAGVPQLVTRTRTRENRHFHSRKPAQTGAGEQYRASGSLRDLFAFTPHIPHTPSDPMIHLHSASEGGGGGAGEKND